PTPDDPGMTIQLYLHIADTYRRIASAGHLRPGAALPSVREVAAVHAINPMTVSRAYSQLEAEGVLERLRGKGMVVAHGARPSGGVAARMQQLEPALREAARHSRELELPVDRVLARLRQLLEEDDA